MKKEKNDITFLSIALFPIFCTYVCGSILKTKMSTMKTNSQTKQLVNKQIFVDLRQDPGFKAVFADINNKSLLIELLN